MKPKVRFMLTEWINILFHIAWVASLICAATIEYTPRVEGDMTLWEIFGVVTLVEVLLWTWALDEE